MSTAGPLSHPTLAAFEAGTAPRSLVRVFARCLLGCRGTARHCPASGGSRTGGVADSTVRAEILVPGRDQQGCSPGRPAVMITDHVPAVRVPPDHAGHSVAPAVPA